MKLINISEENLEDLREISIDSKCTIPHLVFAECNNDRGILVFIELGKYKDYFSHVEVLFNGNIKKLKLLLEYKKEELKYEILKDMCETTDKNFKEVIKETVIFIDETYRNYRNNSDELITDEIRNSNTVKVSEMLERLRVRDKENSN